MPVQSFQTKVHTSSVSQRGQRDCRDAGDEWPRSAVTHHGWKLFVRPRNAALPEVGVPVRIFQGDADALVPLEHRAHMAGLVLERYSTRTLTHTRGMNHLGAPGATDAAAGCHDPVAARRSGISAPDSFRPRVARTHSTKRVTASTA